MKILHWNIHGWADSNGIDNVERVTDFIRSQDPDVVSLVEVDEEWGKPSKLEQVADALGYHWAFVPAFEYREQGGFGNAILSKSAFRSVQQRQLLPGQSLRRIRILRTEGGSVGRTSRHRQ